MKTKRKIKKALLVRYGLLTIGVLIMILPMVFMISSSLRPNEMTFAYPPKLIPALSELTGQNYRYVMGNASFLQYMKNTLVVAGVSTFLTAWIASMLAYSISRFHFTGRDLLYRTIIMTMLIPGLAMILPQFELAVHFRLIDNLWGVILFYTAWMIPFSTFLIKGFIDDIPKEMDEAIYIDGGSILTVYRMAIIPMASPSIAAVSIFNFLFSFEELAWSQTILRSDRLRTIPVALTQFFQAHNRTDWGYVLAMTCLSMIPIVILYILLQKYFISGLSSGAVKG